MSLKPLLYCSATALISVQMVYWMHCRMQLQYSTELMGGGGGGEHDPNPCIYCVPVAVFVCTWACVCKIHSSLSVYELEIQRQIQDFLKGDFVELLCTFTLLNGLNIHSLSLFIVVDWQGISVWVWYRHWSHPKVIEISILLTGKGSSWISYRGKFCMVQKLCIFLPMDWVLQK